MSRSIIIISMNLEKPKEPTISNRWSRSGGKLLDCDLLIALEF
jgi:hypothetical protein